MRKTKQKTTVKLGRSPLECGAQWNGAPLSNTKYQSGDPPADAGYSPHSKALTRKTRQRVYASFGVGNTKNGKSTKRKRWLCQSRFAEAKNRI
jgi:hypothetical protein